MAPRYVVSDYFTKLRKVMADNDLMYKPERIYNIDEKGCQLKLHKTPEVLAECGTKRVHLVAPEHAENVTVVSCGSAVGYAVPPMILYKGKRMKPEWLDSLPTGAVGQMTPKGSMTVDAFVNWIHHFAKYKLPGACILIFDGAKCHLDDSIVDAADKFEIKLFCLPSNTTHELQPMDKSVFRAFEYYWDEEILKYWSQHQDRRITKQRFGAIFSKVWDKALTPSNIKAGFEATGIYPFDPTKIPEEAYAPSIPTHRSSPTVSNVCNEENLSQSLQPNACTNGNTPANACANLNESADNAPIDPHNLYDSEDDIPLATLRQRIKPHDPIQSSPVSDKPNSSIYEILPTPEKVSSPATAQRKKAVNSLALELTNRTFTDKRSTPGPSKTINYSKKQKKNNVIIPDKGEGCEKGRHATHTESWYCFVCEEDKVADMRLCIKCRLYVHEECVGLTSKDKENFICVNCE